MDKNKITNKSVADYYDSTIPWYWIHHGPSNGLHFGYHDETTKNHFDEIINTNRVLAQTAGIKKGELVLDAGCGIGGSAIWLAKNCQARVIGITLSQKQLIKAEGLGKKNKVKDKIQFFLMDYLNTTFQDNTFDVVWAIESVCYAKNKIDFLKEAYRILKKNGRLVVHDGFLKRLPATKEEQSKLDTMYKGFLLDNVPTATSFQADIKKAGFRNVKVWDKRQAILGSVNRVNILCRLGYPIIYALNKLGLIPIIIKENLETGMAIHYIVKHHLGNIFLFYGEK